MDLEGIILSEINQTETKIYLQKQRVEKWLPEMGVRGKFW